MVLLPTTPPKGDPVVFAKLSFPRMVLLTATCIIPLERDSRQSRPKEIMTRNDSRKSHLAMPEIVTADSHAQKKS